MSHQVASGAGNRAQNPSCDLLVTILDAVRVLIMVADRTGRIIQLNRAGETLSGYAGDAVRHMFIWDLLTAESPGLIKAYFREKSLLHFPKRLETFLRTQNGSVRLVVWSNRVVQDDRTGAVFVICTGHDITERRRKNDALRRREREFKALVENAPDIIARVDRDCRILYVNPAVERQQGLKPAQLTGKAIDEIGASEESGGVWRRKLATVFETGKEDTAEFRYSSPRGVRFYHARLAPEFAETGRVVSVLCVIRDVTVHRQTERQMDYLSRHDTLTGLYNRSHFDREMVRISRRSGVAVGLIVCDVDGLKIVNDSLGLEAGDRLLVTVAEHIRDITGDRGLVARVAGGQFVVIVRNGSRSVLNEICRRIREIPVRPAADGNMELTVTVSAGFAVGDSAAVDDLYREAENNMNREKLHHRTSGRSAVVQALMKALEVRDFITEGHGDRLRDMMYRMAKRVGFDEAHRVADLQLLGQFHDIGKVGVPDAILFKPGPLTPGEMREMQRHCEIGYRIAQSTADLAPIADWILKHHEWWNGQGYPMGLKGEEIPLACRVLAIADAYDAMTSDRPYRKAMSRAEAEKELLRCAGTQFDPRLVPIFLEVIDEADGE